MYSEIVLVFGPDQCLLNYITTIKEYPPSDTKCEFLDWVIEGVGPVATALVALSRWGLKFLFAGVIEDDQFGNHFNLLGQMRSIILFSNG
jgi:ribokinase